MNYSVSFYLDTIHRFNYNIKKYLGSRFVRTWLSEIYCALRHGCSPDDYFRYEFYKKSDYERSRFITYRKSQNLIKSYNDLDATDCFSNKVKFNNKFAPFIKRDWRELDNISKEDFLMFAKKHKTFLLKPITGGQGKGILRLNWQEAENNLDYYRDYIAEELLVQHPKMAALHPQSVNTVRVLTFNGIIVACALRIGNNNCFVDNLHSNGICGHIDIESGIVDYPCVDNQLNKYWIHPLTGTVLVGFQVPLWEMVKAEVQKAAKLIPEVNYIGWDVAVLPDTVAIIEGNHDPGHDVVQMISQEGIYTDIRKLINS